jgi:patatin-like phospholipase/acyl hydrolase
MTYHILSMDGGGIRGILTARILERLEAAVPGFLAKVDLFAGTSTGGILTGGLAFGYNPTQLRQLYEECANAVFADTLLDNIKDLGNLIGAQYSVEPLRKALTGHFADTTLAELPRKVLISAFDLDNEAKPPAVRSWKMKFFHNYPGPESDGQELLVDTVVRTSVAPTYFPIYQGYIDGGVAAGNPSMCALAQALHGSTGGQQLNNVVLLSLGTGLNPHYLDSQDGDWGLANWALHLVDIMLEGSNGVADYQCRQVLGDNYHRVNPILPIPIAMDKIRNIPDLLETANNINLDATIAWIQDCFLL